MKKTVIVLILLSLLLTGCGRELPAYELPSDETAQAGSRETGAAPQKEWETFNTYPVDLDVDALLGHTDHEIVFLQGRCAQYYDLELHRAFAFCSQPNCVHNDESCPSYFGGDSVTNTDYAVAGDSIYAVLIDGEDKTLRLRRLRPLTGEKTDLFTDTLPDPVHDVGGDGTPRTVFSCFQYPDLIFTGGALIAQYEIWRQVTRFEADRQYSEVERERHILRYDLETGTLRELFGGLSPTYTTPDGGMFQFNGDAIIDAGDRYALLAHYGAESLPMDLEDYLNTGAGEESYAEYLRDCMQRRVRASAQAVLWDLETGEQTVVCTLNDLRMDSAYALYQHTVCFLKNERELWRLDLKDGSQTKLLDLDMPGALAMLEQWDGRVFFNTCRELDDGSYWYDWYWYEFATGELRQFQKEGGVCKFSIIGETDHYLIGYADGGTHVLSKQDYYNENYDAAASFGIVSLVN